jgi:hypothetical protein
LGNIFLKKLRYFLSEIIAGGNHLVVMTGGHDDP